MVGYRHQVTAVAAIACLMVAGCSGPAEERADAAQASDTSTVAQQSEWTAGIIDQPRPDGRPATLVAVQSSTHDGFDRVVFEFDERVPGYHVEFIDRPVRECGSGNVREMAGDGWLEVRMSLARAHTPEGQPTISERKRMPNLTVLSQLDLTCDFEGVVTWVLGVESPNRYRVQELSSPPRLRIDVQH